MARKSKQIEEHFLNEVMFSKRFSPNQIEAIFDGEYTQDFVNEVIIPGKYTTKQLEMILNGEYTVSYVSKEEIIKRFEDLLTDKEKKKLGL